MPSFASALPENTITQPSSLALPIANQRLTHAVLGGQLRDRQLAAQRLQRNTRLELSRIPLPFARHRVCPS